MSSTVPAVKRLGKWIAFHFDSTLMKVLVRFNLRIPLPERNPFQLVLLIFILFADLLVLTHSDLGSASIEAAGTFGATVTWAIAIAAAGSIVGLLLPDRETGLAIEQYTHSMLCFASWGFVFAVVAHNGLDKSILISGYTAGVAVGAWARACHILFFNRQLAILTGRSSAHIPGGPSNASSSS